MDFIEKERIVHGYNEYVPFQVTDKVIELMEKIKNKTYDEEKLNIGMRELTSSEVLDYGKSFLNDFFNLHYINYLSKESRIKVTSSKMDPSLLCMLYGRLINPFDLPVRFVYNDVFAGDVDINYNFSNKLSVLKRMKIYFEKINLSKNNTIFNAAAYIHELVHTQVEKKGIILNHDNAEVLSMFTELAFLYELDHTLLLAYMDIVRKISDMMIVYDALRDDKTSRLTYYFDANYFVSIAKAIGLFEKYISNNCKDGIMDNVQKVFDGKQTVERLLDNYKIDVCSGLESINSIGSI